MEYKYIKYLSKYGQCFIYENVMFEFDAGKRDFNASLRKENLYFFIQLKKKYREI